jgi:molybdate transport system substrate-binding protein
MPQGKHSRTSRSTQFGAFALAPLAAHVIVAVLLALSVVVMTSCSPKVAPPQQRALSIGAAASLKPALDELIRAFALDRPDVKIEAAIGSTGALSQQIAAGAPFDLFLAADATFPKRLLDTGHAAPDSMRVFGANTISIVLAKDIPIAPDLDATGALTLASTDAITRAALADPRLAPTGAAGKQALTKRGLWAAIEPKLVTADNADRAVAFFITGGAPCAILPTSLAHPLTVTHGAHVFTIPAELHDPLPMALIVTRRANNPADAYAFSEFMLSPAAWEILARHNLQPSPPR